MKCQHTKDHEILLRLSKGDEMALTEIYDLYWKPLYVSSFSLLKNKEVCEEIIQDVFVDIWNQRKKLNIKVSLQSYLYACTRYKVFNQFKKKKIVLSQQLFESLDKRFQYATPETKLIHQELVHKVNEILSTLPPKCKAVYILSRDEKLSHKEISERLQISTKTVENHISKALKILKTSLAHAGSVEIAYFLFQNM